MGKWEGFWNVPGFTWRVKANVDFGGNAATEVSGEKPTDIGWTSDGRPCGRVSREDAKARRKERRRFSVSSLAQVVQLPKTFCGHEGVMECSGLTELGMGIERVDGENPKRCQATAVQETRIRNLTRRREDAKKRKKEVFREFPSPSCAVAQDVLWP
jgi:hypothetical protein